MSERSRPAVLISVVAATFLMVATAAAIVVTQHLRDEGPVVSNIFFKRPPERYRVCFYLTRDDTVQVEMVGASGQLVRVLAPAQPLKGGNDKTDAHCFDWDGRDAAGTPVPPGAYRVRFELKNADRVATSGEHLNIRAKQGGPS